ncbi:MAG: AmmeMemoRadiSam system protein A [Candidatus Woesearchaeota archaeon]
MNPLRQQELLELARKVIEDKNYNLEFISREFKEKHGVFVTLTKKKELRGCVGFIQPIKSIYDSVRENALNAAFHDPRFKPLQKEELKEVKIEISILTVPKRLEYKNEKELLVKLQKSKPGVVLEKGGHQATFLPQVWEEVKEAEEFLRHLSWKAGLGVDEWKSANIFVYEVEKFEEK